LGRLLPVGELKTNIDQQKASAIIDRCLDAGINLFDTAEMI